jgi:DHA2 family multidrug resistance protein
VLDKGQEDDWFGSHYIVTLSVISAICLISLIAWEWLHRDPIMDLRLFKNFNFAMANLMMFTLGVVYFSSLVLIPQFLQTLLGYTAELAGLVLSASGAVLLVAMPIVGQLSARVPAKYLIAFGWASMAVGICCA